MIPPNARVPVPHSHEGFDETAYGPAGTTMLTIEGVKTPLQAGEVAFIARGKVHQIENAGTDAARGLCVITPGLLGPTFFRELADVLCGGGPPDVQRIAAVMAARPAPRATALMANRPGFHKSLKFWTTH